jgi:hypothetical protein
MLEGKVIVNVLTRSFGKKCDANTTAFLLDKGTMNHTNRGLNGII